jgi:predicted DNA-binding protein (UPF0251 family)
MARPTKPRFVEFIPSVTYFKPVGVPLSSLDEVCLGVDELETLRLKEIEGLDQEEAARRMNLSQSTFQRILSGARMKLARAIIGGKALRIQGGHYEVVQTRFICTECGYHLEKVHPHSRDKSRHCPSCGSREWRSTRRHRGHRGGRR